MKTLVLEDMPNLFWQKVNENNWLGHFTKDNSIAEIVIIRTKTQFNKKLFIKYPNLKVIIRAGTGMDNIDMKEAKRRDITVLNTPEANALSAYEHTISFILALIKQHQKWKSNILSNNWKSGISKNWEISDLKILVIGVGRVGTRVAKTMQILGAEVLGVDPYLTNREWKEKKIEKITYQNGLKWCNLLTFHCPLNNETTDYFDLGTLDKLENPIWLINTARGKIINEKLLPKGLQDKMILGFGTDVFKEEPWKVKNYAKFKNVLVTPHVGAFTKKAKKRMTFEVLKVLRHFAFNGKGDF